MPLSDYDGPKAAVAGIQRRLNDTIEEIRSNRSYTPQGRKREMARAVMNARKQADKLKADTVAQRESRRSNLERLAFGIVGEPTPSELMATRDAQDRAAKLSTAEDAATMLHRANQSNDETLAKAVAQAAFNRGWASVANNYADTWDKRGYLDMLADTPAGRNTTAADAAVFRVRAPEELGGLASEANIESFANMDAAR